MMDFKQFSSLSPEKLLFLQNFAQLQKPSRFEDLLPFLLNTLNQAKKDHIQFSNDETTLLIEVLKQNLSKEECEKIDKIQLLLKQRRNG